MNLDNDPRLENPYILCGQINLWTSPTATTELAVFLNDAMENYRYKDESKAGMYLERKQNDKYRQRMNNIGFQLDDFDNVIQTPTPSEKKKI